MAPVTHTFASGLEQPQRTVMQLAAVTLMSALKRSAGGYLQEVRATGVVARTWTDEPGIEMLMRAMNRTPAIAVATGTAEFRSTGIGGKQWMANCELLLYIMTQHQRDLQDGRQQSDVVALANNQADPGLHVIMEHARELLIGQYPSQSSTIKQIRPTSEEELTTRPEGTIWLQTYRVELFQRGGGSPEFRTAAQLLESIAWRVTTDPDEVIPPAAAVSAASVDAELDV